MKKIDHNQLAFLLGIKKEDAKIKILRVKYPDDPMNTIESRLQFDGSFVIDIDEYVKKTGINIRMAINDVRENWSKRPAYKKWILQDFPISKLNQYEPPKKVRLNPALRSILKVEDLDIIGEYWNSHFAGKKYSSWKEDLKYLPELLP